MSIQLIPHHVGISVPDIEAAIAWYGNMLGFVVDQRVHIPQIPAHVVFLKRDSFRIELFEVEGAAPLPEDRRYPNRDLKTHGTKHLAFAVSDVAATLAELRSKGADIAFEVNINGKPAAFIRDIAGNLIEFVRASDFD